MFIHLRICVEQVAHGVRQQGIQLTKNRQLISTKYDGAAQTVQDDKKEHEYTLLLPGGRQNAQESFIWASYLPPQPTMMRDGLWMVSILH